ncbi:MAG: anti-sigma factor family protein [Fidelibacterota bacterium]
MNCYQVRDQISSYIEKELTLPQVTQFETHLSACPSCRDTYEGVVSVVQTLRGSEKVTPSDRFDARLKARLDRVADRPVRRPSRIVHGGTVLGFEPKYAVMSVAALVAIIVLSVSLFPGGKSPTLQGPAPLSTRQSLSSPGPSSRPNPSRSSPDVRLAGDSREDTTGAEREPGGDKPSYEGQIQLVKDQP